jgi:translation initiation factor IF-3
MNLNNNYNRRKPPVKEKKHKTNGEVRFPEVRVIGEIGQGQIMSSYDAYKMAEENGKDLILISENAKPPAVKIEDYGKFLYEIEKREKESKKNQKKSEVKEISLSMVIADHDLGIKSKKALEFLSEGNKVKLSLLLKGRQNSMAQNGQVVMLKFATLVEEIGVPEAMPKLEGNRWHMILKPRKIS